MSTTVRATITLKVQLALWVTVVLWSSSYVFIRMGLHSFHPGSLGLLRYAVAVVCMFCLYFRLNIRRCRSPQLILKAMILGVLGIGAYNVLLNYGEITVTSGIAAFIIGMMPIFTILLAIIMLGEVMPRKSWIGVGLSVLGLVLIAIGESDLSFDYGVLYILVAAILGAYYTAGQKPLLKTLHPLEMACWAILGGALSMTVFTPSLWKDLHEASTRDILAVVYLGVFPAAVGYSTWSYVLMHMPAFSAALYLYVAPIITTILALLLLHEVPSWIAIVGGLVALVGAFLANRFYFVTKNN